MHARFAIDCLRNKMKEYLDENIYVVRNFLSDEEFSTLLQESYEPCGCDIRGGDKNPMQNVWNKFIEGKSKTIFYQDGGIFNKIESLMNTDRIKYKRAYVLQKMTEMPLEEKIALFWHYENKNNKLVAGSFVLYLNNDFEGGELIFQNNDIIVKPEPNMFVFVPAGEEYMHSVKSHHGNDRLTYYGVSFYEEI
jgi:hypothetical protein